MREGGSIKTSLRSIIISYLPDDIMESIISCKIAKATWINLVHRFEGPSDTKETKIMDLKLEYQTFKSKPYESLLQTYTRYKTLLNELTNNGATLSKHEINVGFVNSLLKKWLSFSQDEEEVSDDEEETQVKVLMALVDDELSMGMNHACNGEWIDIIMKKVNIILFTDKDSYWQTYLKYINIDFKDDLLTLKQAKIKAITFQIPNTKLINLNHALQDQLKEERKVNEKWLNSSNKVSQCTRAQIPNLKKKILGGEQLTESSSKIDVKENPFIPASLYYDHEMFLKSKDWVERLNPDRKLLNFNTERILVLESQAVNKYLQLTEALSDLKSSKESGSKPQTPLPLLKNL
ncbi:hypothetical protein Tco_1134480 [Tanacetum coccineum]